MNEAQPPICNYEGSDYQAVFWDQGSRQYEDRVEALALSRLLPKGGNFMLELGAGAGRNTPRYRGYERVALVDYSLTQLQQAQERLGRERRYLYVAADIYRLPFARGVFDGATMIRVLHHMANPLLALQSVRASLKPEAVFILEFANKQNLKAIFRYILRRQSWNPFTQEAVEFAALNYDFHPKAVRAWLVQAGFQLECQLTVSHFRMNILKRLVPLRLLVWLDGLAQHTGDWWQLTPSVFTRSRATGLIGQEGGELFACPSCGATGLEQTPEALVCQGCARRWAIRDGIYDFRNAAE
jgi:ubiquinone/menaquinone biosynthesis C-methylase UbiE